MTRENRRELESLEKHLPADNEGDLSMLLGTEDYKRFINHRSGIIDNYADQSIQMKTDELKDYMRAKFASDELPKIESADFYKV